MRRVNAASSFCPIAKAKCVPVATTSPYRSGNAQPRGYTSASIFRSTHKALPLVSHPKKHSAAQRGPISSPEKDEWTFPLILWANTTLGLIAFWWIGSRQQKGRARLTITQLPGLTVLNPRTLSPEQIAQAEGIFSDFEDRTFLPANEAYRDCTRHALDRAVLVDLLHLSKDALESLAILRDQWCAEPSVHGGKTTRIGV